MVSSQPYQELAMRAIADFQQHSQFRDEAGNQVARTLDSVIEDMIEYVTAENARALLRDMMSRYPGATSDAFMSLDLADLKPWQVVRTLSALVLPHVITQYHPEIFAEDARRESL